MTLVLTLAAIYCQDIILGLKHENIHGACKACLAEQGSSNYDTLPDFKMVIQYFILLPWVERSQPMD